MRKLFSRTPSFRPKFSSRIDTDEQTDALVGGDIHHQHHQSNNVAMGPLSSTSTTSATNSNNNSNNILFGGELDDSDPNKLPQFILDTIDFLMKYGLQVEGIFRVSTHETRKAELINKMNDRFAREKDPHKNCIQPYTVTGSDEVYFASAVLKHYFRSLPTPLIKPQFYETFMLTTKCRDQERNDMLKNAVRLLPVNYYTLLKRICELCFEISKHSSVNKMTCENLSVCWTPNLLINNNMDFMEQMKRTGDAQNVIVALFRDCQTIFSQDGESAKNIERKNSTVQTKKFFLGLTSQTSQEGIAVYNGEKSETGEKHGRGILMLPNGSVFEGEFRNNKYSSGKLVYVTGEQYEGKFVDDLPDDDNGVFRFANMSTYTGQVKKGQLTGIGELRYKDGGIYKGSFINGRREGKGSFEFYEGNQKVRHYDGDWQNDAMSGQGTLINTTILQVYTGQFKNNVYQGQGVLISGLEQNRCEGEFENGIIKNGSGSFTSLNNEFIQFEGSWKSFQFTGKIKIFNFQTKVLEFEGDMLNSKKNGFGKLVYSDGSYYEGQFNNDEMTGTGSFVDSDRVYNGQFVKSLFHGKGKLKANFKSREFVFEGEFREHQPYNGNGSVVVSRKTGDYWDGEFKNGKFSGKGRLTFEDASVYEGDVKNSVCEGKGVVTYPDGSIYSGSFSNDERHGPGTLTIKDGDEKEFMIVSINQVWDHGVLVSQEEPQSPASLDEKESLIFAFLDSLEKEEPLRFGPLVGKEQRPFISTALTKAKENPNTTILYEILYQLSKCRR